VLYSFLQSIHWTLKIEELDMNELNKDVHQCPVLLEEDLRLKEA
jgi:hypothetical protein